MGRGGIAVFAQLELWTMMRAAQLCVAVVCFAVLVAAHPVEM